MRKCSTGLPMHWNSLTRDCVTFIVLHYYGGQKLTEIAASMGISYPYIKKLHQKALDRLKTLMQIIMPLVIPGILAVGIYSFLMTWDDYLHAITLVRSPQLWTLSQGLKLTYLGEVSDWQLINSASILGALPMIVLFFFFQKYMIKGLVAGAVKG